MKSAIGQCIQLSLFGESHGRSDRRRHSGTALGHPDR